MYKVIQELESNNSRLFKEDVIKREAESNNIEFFSGAKLALDPLATFGVKQVPTTDTNPEIELVPWEEGTREIKRLDRCGVQVGQAARAGSELAGSAWGALARR